MCAIKIYIEADPSVVQHELNHSAAIDETYKAIGDIRQKMIDSSIEARKRTQAVLTTKQQEKLRAYREQDRWGW